MATTKIVLSVRRFYIVLWIIFVILIVKIMKQYGTYQEKDEVKRKPATVRLVIFAENGPDVVEVLTLGGEA